VALAMKERRIRIELGSGMESYISNAKAQSIIDTVMVPAFRKGDFAGGLQLALEELMKEARRFVVSPVQVKPSPQQ
ncbi:MAG TPA: TPM domain-containing protein, partial [Burkholderiales bacterium]|nr:TPM domain-containing protein [Burkholderiales bacterium]